MFTVPFSYRYDKLSTKPNIGYNVDRAFKTDFQDLNSLLIVNSMNSFNIAVYKTQTIHEIEILNKK